MAEAPRGWEQPSHWDARIRAGDTPWELGAPSPTLLALASRYLPRGARVAVPGCGRGADAVALARSGRAVTVVDWSHAAVDETMARAARAGLALEGRVGDAFDELPRLGPFGALCEHTFLCALDPSRWPSYPGLAREALAPHGLLLGAFFVGERPAEPGGEGPPFFLQEEQLRELFAGWEWLEAGPSDEAPPGREGFEWAVALRRR